MKRALMLMMALALCTGCEKDKPKEESEPKAAKVETKPEKKAKKLRVSPLSPDTPRTKLGDVPVPEALEEEAERTVAIENLEAELDRLEAEIVGVGD